MDCPTLYLLLSVLIFVVVLMIDLLWLEAPSSLDILMCHQIVMETGLGRILNKHDHIIIYMYFDIALI